jgi:transcriptional regulator with XRE-family HTH domain
MIIPFRGLGNAYAKRGNNEVSQAELGQRLGVSYQMVQAHEHGEKLTAKRVAIIADILHVKARWLLVALELEG